MRENVFGQVGPKWLCLWLASKKFFSQIRSTNHQHPSYFCISKSSWWWALIILLFICHNWGAFALYNTYMCRKDEHWSNKSIISLIAWRTQTVHVRYLNSTDLRLYSLTLIVLTIALKLIAYLLANMTNLILNTQWILENEKKMFRSDATITVWFQGICLIPSHTFDSTPSILVMLKLRTILVPLALTPKYLLIL